MAASRGLNLSKVYFYPSLLFFLITFFASTKAESTSVIKHSSGGLVIQDAAVIALEALSTANQWRVNDQVTFSGLVEDVSVADSVKYDFRVSGEGTAPEGLEFSIGEEPSFWEEIGDLELPSGKGKEGARDAPLANQHSGLNPLATLPETDITGPVELWFRDSSNMRLSLPHDIEAGPLSRVVIADGVTVSVVGASKLSLARPIKLPLSSAEALSAKEVASLIRNAARQSERPVLSLVVTGAVALTSKSPLEEQDGGEVARLKVKRLSPSSLEVSLRQKTLESPQEAVTEKLWPFSNLLGSDERVVAVQAAMQGLVGNTKTVNLLKAEASAFKLVRMQLTIEKKLSQPVSKTSEHAVSEVHDDLDLEQQTWEVVVKVDGKSRPEPLTARRVGGLSEGTVSVSWSVATGNGTFVAPESPNLNTVGLMDLAVIEQPV